MRTQLKPAIVLLALFTLITGLLYPLAVTAAAQLVFPRQANGSLIIEHGQPVGSSLIGQPFSEPKYFWGRPSATAPTPYNAAASAGSNLGPTSATLIENVQARIAALRTADPANTAPIPVDLVTASASGLDPDISVAAARYQAARVARARGLGLAAVNRLIDQFTTGRTFGLLGEPRVNVLLLNRALDGLQL
ncbi:MAG: Potassium-transporting ATPase KdpC subunit [Anaerolineae bacterium]|nr:Potassium-transporting ATPase KdpC subunit [Anaerolineae bacterium]